MMQMNSHKFRILILTTVFLLTMISCGSENKPLYSEADVEATVTAKVQKESSKLTPTAPAITDTPIPSSTPVPQVITSNTSEVADVRSFTLSSLSELIPVCENAFVWDPNYFEVDSKYIVGEFELISRKCKSPDQDSAVSIEIERFDSSENALKNMNSVNSMVDESSIFEWNMFLKDSLWGELIKYRAFTYMPTSSVSDEVVLELEASVANFNVSITSIINATIDEGPEQIIPRLEAMRTSIGKIISQLNSSENSGNAACAQLKDTVFVGKVDDLGLDRELDIYILLLQNECAISGDVIIDDQIHIPWKVKGFIEDSTLQFSSNDPNNESSSQFIFMGSIAGDANVDSTNVSYLSGSYFLDGSDDIGSWGVQPKMVIRWALEDFYWIAYEFLTEQNKGERDFPESNEILVDKMGQLMRYYGEQLLNFNLHPLDSWPFCIDTYMTLFLLENLKEQRSPADAGLLSNEIMDHLEQMQFNYETIAPDIDPRSKERELLFKSQCDEFAADLFVSDLREGTR